MAQDGLIHRTDTLLGYEREFADLLYKTPQQADLTNSQVILRKHLLEVGNSGDIDSILAVERLILENERKHFGNSASMNSSLDAGLQEVKQCQYMLQVVRDPKRYEELNRNHALPKSRDHSGLLPKDDARIAFRGHCTRITNLDRGRLSEPEKRLLKVRRKNFGIAEKIYISLQRSALGIAPPVKNKSTGLER